MISIINSDVQIFQIYSHTTRIPDFRVIGPSENRLESDMSESPDFYSSEIRGDIFTDFCVHTPRFSGNRLQKVGRLKKIGQWDHGITLMFLWIHYMCSVLFIDLTCQLGYTISMTSLNVVMVTGEYKRGLFVTLLTLVGNRFIMFS